MADGGPLSGKVAIVTGAGRGIGRGIALELASAGADVAFAARSIDALEEAAAEARSAHDVRAAAIAVDVTDAGSVEAMVAAVETRLGQVDILVNNSGILVEGFFLDQDQDEFDRVIATNLRGTALCCRAVGRRLTEQGGGKIVNVASHLGIVAAPGVASYCASKAAIINLTRALALEWARFGVQVNAIAPGYVETEMTANVRGDEERLRRVLGRIPIRRFATPAEIGRLVTYLVGPGSDFITGECIVADGGQISQV